MSRNGYLKRFNRPGLRDLSLSLRRHAILSERSTSSLKVEHSLGPGPRMKRTLRELVLQLFHPTDPIQLNAYSRTLVPCQASSKPQAAASLRQSFVDGAALPGVGGINFLGFPFRDHGWRKTTETQRGSQWIGAQ